MQRRKYALLKQPFELDALGDVVLTNPVLSEVLVFDGTNWVNGPVVVPDEDIDDRVAALLVAGNNIDITYNDGANTITIDVEPLTSADITDFATAVDFDAILTDTNGDVLSDASGNVLQETA